MRALRRPHHITNSLGQLSIECAYPAYGEHVNVRSIVAEHYVGRTSFNYAYFDFGSLFHDIRNSVVRPNNRVTSSTATLDLLPKSRDVQVAFKVIKRYANNPHSNWTQNSSEEFLNAFKNIFQKLEDNFAWSQADYFIVPLRGGGIVTQLFPLSQSKILAIDCKRLPLKAQDGLFGFGMHVDAQSPAITNVQDADNLINSAHDKVVTMLEVCVASGITTIGFLMDLHNRGIKPRELRVLATAVSQQGYELTLSVAESLGYNIHYVTGLVAYGLADPFTVEQDPLIYDDGEYIVISPADAFRKYKERNSEL